jgi:hypothetical protein
MKKGRWRGAPGSEEGVCDGVRQDGRERRYRRLYTCDHFCICNVHQVAQSQGTK